MKHGKYIVIDTEATSLNIRNGGLIQIAAAALDPSLEIIETIVFDICPPDGYEMEKEAMSINGISQERIRLGVSYPEACDKLVSFIDTHFEHKPIAVAHYYPFDWGYITEMFIQASNHNFKKISKFHFTNQFIDTKAIVTYANTVAEIQGKELPFPITSLSRKGGVKDVLGVSGDYLAHDALGDVMATIDVFKKLVERGYVQDIIS